MKRYPSILKKVLVTLPTLGLVISATNAWAGSRIYDVPDTCTQDNCGATILRGTPQRNANGDSDPFTLQVYSDGNNQCMRLDVTEQNADMEMILISPSGKIWSNDDRVGSDRRPLIKANTDVDGFYTLQINYYNGQQPVNSVQGFTLAYGLYNNGNSNCANPTQSLAGARGAAK